MDTFESRNSLAHYGVKGMKWGVRRRRKSDVSRRTARLQRAVQEQKKVVKSWQDTSAIKDKKGRTLLSEKDVKSVRDASQKRLEKMEYKAMISQRRDQINRGESAFGRLYNKLTGADKIQAEIELDMEKRAKVNKAWRD